MLTSLLGDQPIPAKGRIDFRLCQALLRYAKDPDAEVFSELERGEVEGSSRTVIGEHCVVDSRGRIRHEFGLERALIRQRRSLARSTCISWLVCRGVCAGVSDQAISSLLRQSSCLHLRKSSSRSPSKP